MILFVDQEEALPPVLSFRDRYQLTSPFVMDPIGSVGALYNLVSTPTTYFVDGRGVIQDIVVGVLQLRWLESNLARSLQ